MSQKVWLGGIYLKEEGGYELVIRSLHHYKKRLRNIRRAPEVKDAPMFAQLIEQEAMKAYQLIDKTINKIKEGLQNSDALKDLESDISIFEKALNCYYSDIAKINSDPFYSDLIPDKKIAESDYNKIKNALEQINRFDNH
jgi:hypothetical protein